MINTQTTQQIRIGITDSCEFLNIPEPIILFVPLAHNITVMTLDTPRNRELIPAWQKAYDTHDYDALIKFFPYMKSWDFKSKSWMV